MLKITLEGPAGSGKTFLAERIKRICEETGHEAVVSDELVGKTEVLVRRKHVGVPGDGEPQATGSII